MHSNQTQASLAIRQPADEHVAMLDEHIDNDSYESSDDMTFFMHYIAVCVVLVLAMASLLDPYAVLIGVVMAIAVGLAVWLVTSLAEMFNEYMNRGE